MWRSDSRRLPPTGSCEYGVIQPRIFWCKIDADSHESHKTDDQPRQRIDITLNGLRYGGTGFSYKKHANYAAVLIADRTIIGEIRPSVDQSVGIKMIFTGIQNITDHHVRSTGADNAVTLGVIQSRQNAGILIEQGDVKSGILFELIK